MTGRSFFHPFTQDAGRLPALPAITIVTITGGKQMQKKVKDFRSMKVQEKSGYRYRPTPAIILSWKWLAEFGFDIGDYVKISCENGRLVITPDTERAALEESEAREMELLQKRFDVERRKLHAQFVAERKTGYDA